MSDEISTEVRHDELPEELDVTVSRPWKVPTTDSAGSRRSATW